jgi:hypothetical protein
MATAFAASTSATLACRSHPAFFIASSAFASATSASLSFLNTCTSDCTLASSLDPSPCRFTV